MLTRRVLVEPQPFHFLTASIIHFLNKSVKMVENLIKTYRITPEKLQDYLQRLFPGHNIVITVSTLAVLHPLASRHFPRLISSWGQESLTKGHRQAKATAML